VIWIENRGEQIAHRSTSSSLQNLIGCMHFCPPSLRLRTCPTRASVINTMQMMQIIRNSLSRFVQACRLIVSVMQRIADNARVYYVTWLWRFYLPNFKHSRLARYWLDPLGPTTPLLYIGPYGAVLSAQL